MVEKNKILNGLIHLSLMGVGILFLLPLYFALMAVLFRGEFHLLINSGAVNFLWNSFIMAVLIAIGKTVLALLSAFALVYFHFPLKKFFLGMILFTLVLPIEVRLLPTLQMVIQWHLFNSYAGLVLPLLASATGTLLLRQLFLSIPPELTELAKLDGVSAWRFLIDILVPLICPTLIALWGVMFVYGWAQYVWPWVVTVSGSMTTAMLSIKQYVSSTEWGIVMAMVLFSFWPPVAVILLLQRWILQGIVAVENANG